ncbi:hypothetical protein L3X38_008007 [Prunus dulcis]|uniref:C2 NT-type domain-containing protein n=1 Tax=Prunus dulcis TaxID=3755 RepID=A0AAD5F6I0_PRUDU|nr:hypothetical protein L3X38_008007 [Prunus dulcis]
MKWSPWTRGGTKRFHVKVNQIKLEGFDYNGKVVGDEKQRVGVVVEVKWKGSQAPFYGRRSSRHQKNYTSHRFLSRGHEVVEWDDEFQSLCSFGWKQGGAFSPWDLTFTLLHGESAILKGMVVLGKVSLNLAEMASKMESQIQRKLSVTLKMEGMNPREATLLVCLSFSEVRNSHDSAGLGQDSARLGQDSADSDKDRLLRGVSYSRSFRKTSNNERKGHGDRVMTSSDWDESSLLSDSEGSSPENELSSNGVSAELSSKPELGSSPSCLIRFDSGQKSWFLRKRKWLSGKPPRRRKVEPYAEKTSKANALQISADNNLGDSIQKSDTTVEYSSNHQHGDCITSRWELKEVFSRDGLAKLKTNVFFASFDQRSEKAAGESACTALVAVIAHWLHSNQDLMPTISKFDSLITEGSTEWQKLCSNETYINLFPNKHFDLETVLEADVRPLDVLPDKSFIGFFSPEKFECLKGLMSFDEIWDEINRNTMLDKPRIYIVSWNDHFFVLKVEGDAYYIMDSLGERLFEGCNQAYILKFDDSSIMYGKAEAGSEDIAGSESNKEESLEELCSGKECCRQFIKRFLAAIPLGELEEEEKKGTVSTLPLHRRLQIEFHYTSSSSSSSTLSSATSSTYSLFSGEESA